MSKFINITAFTAGVVLGTVVAWQYFKHKYERLAQEEIDSVKKVFSKKENDEKEPENSYDTTVSLYSEVSDFEKEKEGKPVNDRPYVISPDEFGEIEEYERISLIYYADQVLTDDNDEPVEDVDNVVGLESLTHFGEYEDDSVFVRNNRLKADYEILIDHRTYSDVLKKRII